MFVSGKSSFQSRPPVNAGAGPVAIRSSRYSARASAGLQNDVAKWTPCSVFASVNTLKVMENLAAGRPVQIPSSDRHRPRVWISNRVADTWYDALSSS